LRSEKQFLKDWLIQKTIATGCIVPNTSKDTSDTNMKTMKQATILQQYEQRSNKCLKKNMNDLQRMTMRGIKKQMEGCILLYTLNWTLVTKNQNILHIALTHIIKVHIINGLELLALKTSIYNYGIK
jgi:hypothetical protein